MFGNPFKRSRKSDGEIIGTSYDSDQVKTLQDKVAQLNNDKKLLIETNEKNLKDIRETYEDQIAKLSSSLKDTSNSKSKVEVELSELQDEFQRLEAVKEKMSNSIINLQRRCHLLEESSSKVSENSKYQDLFKTNKVNERNLQEARRKNSELENQVKTLEDEVKFNKRIQSNLNKSSESSVSFLNSTHEQEIDNLKKAHELDRNKLFSEFENNYKNMEEKLQSLKDELNSLKESSQREISNYETEQRTLRHEFNFVRATLGEKEKLIQKLKTELELCRNELEQVKSDKDKMEKLATEEIDMLKYQLNLNVKEVNKLMKEKQEIEELPDKSNRKRRRVDGTTDDNIQMEALTKGNVTVGCQQTNNGKYCLVLNNVSKADVDLNEWRLMFSSIQINGELEYAFAPRILEKGATLYVWNLNDNIEDDKHNLLLNIDVPINKHLKCQLLNDMYEAEASFKIKP